MPFLRYSELSNQSVTSESVEVLVPDTKHCTAIWFHIHQPANAYVLPDNMSHVFNKNECPFCGGQPIQSQSLLDRIDRATVGANLLEPSTGAPAVGIGGAATLKPTTRHDYRCNGCNQEFVWADIDMNLIIKHLSGTENIPLLVKHYYPDGVTLTELLKHYVTGCVRKPKTKSSWLSKDRTRRHLIVCLNYKGVRTFCTFERLINTRECYVIKTMEIVDI